MNMRFSWLRAGRIAFVALVLAVAWLIPSATTVLAVPIEITVSDTALYPGQEFYLSFWISTEADTVAAFQFNYGMDRPNVARFPSELLIDTVIGCLNPPSCTVQDTVIDTFTVVPFATEGDLCENWDAVYALPLATETNVRLSGLSDLSGQRQHVIPPFTQQQRLMRVKAQVLCHPDPFAENEVILFGQLVNSLFSDPRGQIIEPFLLGPATITVKDLVPGDLDYSGLPDAVDLNAYIQCIFFNTCPDCDANLDYDCDGLPNSVDLNLLIQHLFFNGPLSTCP